MKHESMDVGRARKSGNRSSAAFRTDWGRELGILGDHPGENCSNRCTRYVDVWMDACRHARIQHCMHACLHDCRPIRVYLGGCQLSFGREQLGSRGIIFQGGSYRTIHVGYFCTRGDRSTRSDWSWTCYLWHRQIFFTKKHCLYVFIVFACSVYFLDEVRLWDCCYVSLSATLKNITLSSLQSDDFLSDAMVSHRHNRRTRLTSTRPVAIFLFPTDLYFRL